MAVTVNLKKQVDIPVWEWMRFAPTASAATSAMTCSDGLSNRYLYYLTGTTFYKYDTYTDQYMLLASPMTAAVTGVSLRYATYQGYYGRVLAHLTNTTFEAAGLYGNILKGYKIRIYAGTGVGQERTITNVSEPTVLDSGLMTGISTTLAFTDTLKNWAFNAYTGYQVRLTFNAGYTQWRKVLYNNATTITVADNNLAAVDPWNFNGSFAVSPNATAGGTQTSYAIEKSTFTIDTAWTVNPDTTSKFVVLSGGIWMLSGAAATPFYTLQYYDVAADVWYAKSAVQNLLPAVATDYSLERTGEVAGAYDTGTATSASATTLVNSGKTMTSNRFKGYQCRITGGTGVGQKRTILSNDPTTFTLIKPWDTTPSTDSTYSIFADTDKIYLAFGAHATTLRYDVNSDIAVTGKTYDSGVCRLFSAQLNGHEPIGLASITRSGTTATATTGLNHNYKTGDLITIKGATDALYNVVNTSITVTSATVFTYSMAGTPSGSAASTGTISVTVVVDGSKNWTNNQFQNYLCVVYPAGIASAGQARKIASNTNNTITLASAVTVPVNALTRYVIHDLSAFGDLDTGTCTGVGTTTTIVDSTKSWPVNLYAGRRVKITSGTNQGYEGTIASNTSTQLTFAPAAGAVTDATSPTTYSILQNQPRGTGIQLQWAFGNSDTANKGKYIYCARGGATNSVDRYDITTETWTQLSFAPQMETLSTGSMYCYDGGDRIYFQKDNTHRLYYYDITTNTVNGSGTAPYIGGTACLGNRLEIVQTEDGLKYLYFMRHTAAEMFRTLIFW